MRFFTFFTLSLWFASFNATAQVSGCTDPAALNYNPAATVNNGNCNYQAVSVSADYTVSLPDEVAETSGLIFLDGKVYTHNDNTDLTLYGLDTDTGAVNEMLVIEGVSTTDWEEITQDENYIYIGDFGNNAQGNRTDLKILRVDKDALLNGSPEPEFINFSYSDQTSFSPVSGNSTDFDCEAFIASQDSLYLFTKQWASKKTKVYALPKQPGTYVAQYKDVLNVNGLITGATYVEDKHLVVLCGYSNLLQPFFYLLYDFEGHDFFSGNKRKINISAPFHQTEGITTADGLHYFVSNEKFVQAPIVNVPQKMGYYNLSEYLGGYIQNIALDADVPANDSNVLLFPNPTDGTLHIVLRDNISKTGYRIIDMTGQQVAAGALTAKDTVINISSLQGGMYIFKVDIYPSLAFKLVKM